MALHGKRVNANSSPDSVFKQTARLKTFVENLQLMDLTHKT